MVQGMLRNLRRKIRCLNSPTSFAAHSLLKFARVLFETMMSRDRAFTCLRCLHLSCHVDRHEFWWCQMAVLIEMFVFSRRIFQMSVAHEAKADVGHSQPHNGSEECCYVEELEHAFFICFNGIVRIMSEFHLSILGHFVEFRIHNSLQNVRNFRAATKKDEQKLKRIQPCICLQPADVSPLKTSQGPCNFLTERHWAPPIMNSLFDWQSQDHWGTC